MFMQDRGGGLGQFGPGQAYCGILAVVDETIMTTITNNDNNVHTGYTIYDQS